MLNYTRPHVMSLFECTIYDFYITLVISKSCGQRFSWGDCPPCEIHQRLLIIIYYAMPCWRYALEPIKTIKRWITIRKCIKNRKPQSNFSHQLNQETNMVASGQDPRSLPLPSSSSPLTMITSVSSL